MGTKAYPPQPMLHDADCIEAPTGAIAFPARSAGSMYPHAFPHYNCIGPGTIGANKSLVAAPIDFDPHDYEPSSEPLLQPTDAVGPLCKICHGNHFDGSPAPFADPIGPARS